MEGFSSETEGLNFANVFRVGDFASSMMLKSYLQFTGRDAGTIVRYTEPLLAALLYLHSDCSRSSV